MQFTAQHKDLAGGAVQTPTTLPTPVGQAMPMATMVPLTAQAPAASPAGRQAAGDEAKTNPLKARDTGKQESLAEQSQAQAAKEACANKQRRERREAAKEERRQRQDALNAETEADRSDAELSDTDTHR